MLTSFPVRNRIGAAKALWRRKFPQSAFVFYSAGRGGCFHIRQTAQWGAAWVPVGRGCAVPRFFVWTTAQGKQPCAAESLKISGFFHRKGNALWSRKCNRRAKRNRHRKSDFRDADRCRGVFIREQKEEFCCTVATKVPAPFCFIRRIGHNCAKNPQNLLTNCVKWTILKQLND